MENNMDKIIFHGIRYSINSKQEFMKRIIYTPEVQKEIIKIVKKPHIMNKLHSTEFFEGDNILTNIKLYNEDLDIIFDELIGKKIGKIDLNEKFDEEKRMHYKEFLDVLSDNGKEVDFDIIYLVTFGICHQDKCQDLLKEIWTNNPEYYAYFKENLKVNQSFESSIDARYVTYARMIFAMITMMREYKSEEIYDKIMKLINVGFRHLKNALKGRTYLDSDIMRDIIGLEVNKNDRLFLRTISEVPILMILAESKGIDIIYDYETLVFLGVINKYEDELNSKYEDISPDIPQRTAEQQTFIDNFNEKFGTMDSMTDIYTNRKEEFLSQQGLFLMLFWKYNIGIRKFSQYYLNEEEIDFILNSMERLNNKNYWYSIHMASMCKYIRTLEDAYIDLSENTSSAEDYSYNEKKESLMRIADDIEKKRRNQEQIEKNQNESIVKLERELRLEKEKYESDMQKYEAEHEELKALRNYVYVLNEENSINDDYKAEEEKINVWNQRRVIVFGGYESWQKKLKKFFPNWVFILTENKSFSNSIIKDKDYIICNTEVMSHALYYKIISACNKGQRLLYVRSNNIDLFMQELIIQDK